MHSLYRLMHSTSHTHIRWQTLHVGVIVDDYGRNLTAREQLRSQLRIPPGHTVVTLAARLDAMKQPLIFCKVIIYFYQSVFISDSFCRMNVMSGGE